MSTGENFRDRKRFDWRRVIFAVSAVVASTGIGLSALAVAGYYYPESSFLPVRNAWTLVKAIYGTTYEPPPKVYIGPQIKIPLIYLYPTEDTDVTVRLAYSGTLTVTSPAYDDRLGGWRVRVGPDGTFTDPRDGKKYHAILWEGNPAVEPKWDRSHGFVVRGSETETFLRETLARIGLTPREYNEFIVYWSPILQRNPYNFISFAEKEYAETAPLDIDPKPDAVLRVFMVAEPLDTFREIPPQRLMPFARTGFTVVEWGGAVIGKE